MNDSEIIDLYWQRNQEAITQTSLKYENLLKKISFSILSQKDDVEENINDSYFSLWNLMPPKRPLHFPAFICKVARNLALKKYEYINAQKRNPNVSVSLTELEECVSGSNSVIDEAERAVIAESINRFLKSQRNDYRAIFIKRYFYFLTVKEISEQMDMSETKITTVLHRMRKSLKQALIKEGYDI